MDGKEYHRKYYQQNKRKNRLKSIWTQMLRRCYKPGSVSYKYYGAKGIGVCDEWRNDYKAFERWAMGNGYSEQLTIDRIDNNKNYTPENCRWATHKEQQNNTAYNKLISYRGETHNVTQWSEITGISRAALYNRIRRGWNIERALTQRIGGN